jgi:hypothetical protein
MTNEFRECTFCAAGRFYGDAVECDCCGREYGVKNSGRIRSFDEVSPVTSLSPIISEEPLPPRMVPTEDQAEALRLMEEFLSTPYLSNPWAFLLEGYAGTGKSFSITELAKSGKYKPSEICFTAPTNKAVKVLRAYLNDAGLEASPTRTIYSLLGLSLQANGEVKELTKPEEPIDLSSLKVVVVDESSMVNRFLMDAIEDSSINFKLPYIFMGDPAQLPPIGELRSPAFKIENKFTLTKVLRYGNSMLDLATRIRNVVDSPFPSIKIETADPVFRVTKPEWLDRIRDNIELLKSGDAKIIAWRNVKVDEYNSYVRRLIYGIEAKRDPWIIGDKIVAKAPLKNLDDETIMQNAEEGIIEAIAIGSHPKHTEFEIYNLLVLHEDGRKVTLRVTTPSGQFALNNRLNELSMEAKSGKRYKWREFWQLKDSFHEIKHAYAMTSHGAQGSSYRITFIDLEDIMLNRNRPEAFRSLYVAATRQREAVYFC